MNTIEVKDLSKVYESYKKDPGFLGTLRSLGKRKIVRTKAVSDVSFSIAEGEFVGFIGPNGAGKTTTLKMLSGILWPTSGTATVLGHIPWRREREFQKQFAIVMGQKNQLWWDLPARDSFALNQAIYEIPKHDFEKRVKQLSEMLQVNHLLTKPVRTLSLGERMKCELINALLHRPRVLYLDEPTIGLDVVAQKTIREFLKKWNKEEGATVILTSHAMADVEALCERLVVIQDGRIRYDGPRQKISDRAGGKDLTVEFSKPVHKQFLLPLSKHVVVEPGELKARFDVPKSELGALTKALLDRFPVVDIEIKEQPLEDTIRTMFSHGKK